MKKGKKLKIKEQGIFLNRISDMLDNGFTLSESLHFISRLNHQESEMYQSMINSLQTGSPIHEVFHRQNFDSQACSQIYFAEKHGYLSKALKESGQYLLRKSKEREKLGRLLQYPLVLLLVLLLVGTLLKTLLLPRFEQLYNSMGYQPGAGIKLVLHILHNIPLYLIILSVFLSLCIIIATLIFRKKTALEMAEIISAIPLINSFYKLYQTVFFSREWSFLLKSGFSMYEIISIMETQNIRPLLRESAEGMRESLTVGFSFSDALSRLCFIEHEMVMIVAHGEQNGRLDSELLYYSQFCLQKLEDKTMKVFTIIQPIIFALIGLMVVAIYMSIFLPMFQMMDAI